MNTRIDETPSGVIFNFVNRVDVSLLIEYNRYMNKQIKSKSRVTQFGEVYTAKQQVDAMVDLVDDTVRELTSTVLEPACGNGNFLAEILNRKIQTADALFDGDMQRYTILLAKAVSSIYGVDIQRDNVIECRQRLTRLLMHAFKRTTTLLMSPALLHAIEFILSKNIVCGNTLTAETDSGSPLTFSEWAIQDDGLIVRLEYRFDDLLNGESDRKLKTYKYDWIRQCKEPVSA